MVRGRRLRQGARFRVGDMAAVDAPLPVGCRDGARSREAGTAARHNRLHVARTDPGPAGRRAERPVRVRHHALRDAHRHATRGRGPRRSRRCTRSSTTIRRPIGCRVAVDRRTSPPSSGRWCASTPPNATRPPRPCSRRSRRRCRRLARVQSDGDRRRTADVDRRPAIRFPERRRRPPRAVAGLCRRADHDSRQPAKMCSSRRRRRS